MPAIAETLDAVRHADGRVEIHRAPIRTLMTLGFLTAADPAVVRVTGSRIELAGQAVYRVIGWDASAAALVAELVDDEGVPHGG